jgi:hypothetical protein
MHITSLSRSLRLSLGVLALSVALTAGKPANAQVGSGGFPVPAEGGPTIGQVLDGIGSYLSYVFSSDFAAFYGNSVIGVPIS